MLHSRGAREGAKELIKPPYTHIQDFLDLRIIGSGRMQCSFSGKPTQILTGSARKEIDNFTIGYTSHHFLCSCPVRPSARSVELSLLTAARALPCNWPEYASQPWSCMTITFWHNWSFRGITPACETMNLHSVIGSNRGPAVGTFCPKTNIPQRL